MSGPAETLPIPSAEGSRPVRSVSETTVYTSRVDCDVRTALTRGLKEYLAQLRYADDGAFGEELRLKTVFDDWAQSEDLAEYPSAAVYSVEDGTYGAPAGFTPRVNSKLRLPEPDGRYVVTPCEYKVNLMVEAWSTNPEQRSLIGRMLEESLTFVTDGMYGLRLVLPHYFGSHATYELLSNRYVDTADDALVRFRVATYLLQATVAMVKLVQFSVARKEAARVDVEGVD